MDTCVWSLALRRRDGIVDPMLERFQALIAADDPLAVPGIVLQEVLSGVRDAAQFEKVVEGLAPYPVLLPRRADHILAAEVATACRRAGIASTAPDCLIAAQAIERDALLLTTDRDFEAMARLCDLRLMR